MCQNMADEGAPLPTKCSLPLSTSMPAYSKVNRRRRVTCNLCGLPLGYVPLSAVYLEAELAELYEINKKRVKKCATGEGVPLASDKPEPTTHSTNERNESNVDYFNPGQKICRRVIVRCDEYTNEPHRGYDNRLFLSMFLPDCMNVRVTPRCETNQKDKEEQTAGEPDDLCGIPYMFRFLGGSIQAADEVHCAGCNSCLGVRFYPNMHTGDIPFTSWRSSKFARTLNLHSPNTPAIAEEEDQSSSGRRRTVVTTSFDNLYTRSRSVAEEEGWITLSLEQVAIEPLFSLVGLDQFSIRYTGGEMAATFYRSIEANSLYSQNSATWMLPTRRTRSQRVSKSIQGVKQEQSWDKIYYDLQRIDKTVPNTLGHGDLVQGTIRRLIPVYPTEHEGSKTSEDSI
ncbi:unnamed protein product [Calicophoron daubneyi]|uniref:Uncharacterized protein n=1 Tax=Calicophoron daubneyi TaxID=300641 RepID=A0AAV2T068_CALDB